MNPSLVMLPIVLVIGLMGVGLLERTTHWPAQWAQRWSWLEPAVSWSEQVGLPLVDIFTEGVTALSDTVMPPPQEKARQAQAQAQLTTVQAQLSDKQERLKQMQAQVEHLGRQAQTLDHAAHPLSRWQADSAEKLSQITSRFFVPAPAQCQGKACDKPH